MEKMKTDFEKARLDFEYSKLKVEERRCALEEKKFELEQKRLIHDSDTQTLKAIAGIVKDGVDLDQVKELLSFIRTNRENTSS